MATPLRDVCIQLENAVCKVGSTGGLPQFIVVSHFILISHIKDPNAFKVTYICTRFEFGVY